MRFKTDLPAGDKVSTFYYFADDWVKCDDDKMSNVTSEDILKLSGGGRCSRTNTIQKAWFPSLCGQSLLV